MSNVHMIRRLTLSAGAAALVMMGALTAGCSSSEEGPSTTTTPSATTTPSSTATTPSTAVSETEKALIPGGNNSFSPTIDPTQPGGSCKSVVNGVCIR